jgi:hypothetical protein
MTIDRPEPDAANDYRVDHALLLLRSFKRLIGRDLIRPGSDPIATAHDLYCAPFVLLSHDASADPVFTYANLTAQRLFEMPWQEFVRLPSRFSAEPMLREERQRLLERVSRQGYIDDYQGIRVSRTGRRFLVSKATVWDLADDQARIVGQAATFDTWRMLG